MKRSLLLLTPTLALALTGCARFTTVQTDKSHVGTDNKPIREITTTAKATTFFASKSALANWKAAQTDKTQGASVGSLSQEANADATLGATLGAALKAYTGK